MNKSKLRSKILNLRKKNLNKKLSLNPDRIETIECWEHALKSTKTPSVLSLTRQNLNPVRKTYPNKNLCSLGAYEVLRTNKKINLTILASGSEVNLALEVSHKLAKDKICLLYTSPSPRDKRQSRMPSSA